MWWLVVILTVFAGALAAQTREVNPDDLTLTVTIDTANVAPFQQEMVLLTIHGVYRRHITLEKLEQPDLTGFNWMQLGQDHWYESRINGQKVKNLERRMALFPESSGTLTIGPFIHHLTLTDEGDDWFTHDIRSAPVTLQVLPAPPVKDWWFPVRRLTITDNWSNAPDQLKDGEGVLRVIQLTAIGASPDMFPPMPTLTSPSAMIFAHPEQRFVELSPEGPMSFAYWRWTVRPTNTTSAILEPLSFDYFDTVTREAHTVTISAQRIAYDPTTLPAPPVAVLPSKQYPVVVWAGFLGAFGVGLGALLFGRQFAGMSGLRRMLLIDPERRALSDAVRRQDLASLRRAAHALTQRDGANPTRSQSLKQLDAAIFGRSAQAIDLRKFEREFLKRRPS